MHAWNKPRKSVQERREKKNKYNTFDTVSIDVSRGSLARFRRHVRLNCRQTSSLTPRQINEWGLKIAQTVLGVIVDIWLYSSSGLDGQNERC